MKYSLALWAVWYAYWIVSACKRVRDTADSAVQRERALHQHFGGAYEEYARRVPGLLPAWPAS